MITEPVLHTALNTSHSSILWLIPFLPAFGALLNGVTGRWLKNNKIVDIIALGSVATALLLTIYHFIQISSCGSANRLMSQTLWVWLDFGEARVFGGITSNLVNWAYRFDSLSGTMALLVTGVGFLIHLFSTGYMVDERKNGEYYRFMAYLNLFMFSMLNLVLGANIIMMFLGWEGVGLCSYLLIGFYFNKEQAAIAGKKAFVVNRIGDFGFLIGFFLIFAIYGTSNFDVLMDMTQHIANNQVITIFAISHTPTWWFNLIGCCLFLGACGKSAQIPLYVWLPDAMAGPTPVSALIHAATMVTSGLYMITRMNFIYTNAPIALNIILFVGATTAIAAASIGLAQYDIKKVLAYSTVSQLGIMFMGMGTGDFSAGMFHVFTHAFFKAALFLGSGSVIMACHHEQDMRNMGGLRKFMPWTFASMGIATLAIAGVFPFAGFFSKDEIFWKVFEGWYNHGHYNGSIINLVAWIMGMLAAFMTAFYMVRLMTMTFFGEYRGHLHNAHNDNNSEHNREVHMPKEVPWNMCVPVVILAILATISGFLNVPHSLHWIGKDHFSQWLAPLLYQTESHHMVGEAQPLIEYILMIITTLLWVPGSMALAWWFYASDPTWSKPKSFVKRFPKIFTLVNAKYYVDECYETVFINPCKQLGAKLFVFDTAIVDGVVNGLAKLVKTMSNCSNWFDANIIDRAVNLLAWTLQQLSFYIRKLQNGQLQNYAFIMYLSFLVIVFWKFII